MKDHPKVKIGNGDKNYNWLPDFVYAGIDGSVTTFAVVAGVVGASLSTTVILILGFANIFADAFSMSTGKYLSDKSNKEIYKRIEEIEFRHLKEKTKVEKEEVREILKKYGFKGKNLETATETITSNPKAWVDLMMRNEFKMCRESVHPMKGAITTFVSFVAVGFIPLIAYTFNSLLKLSQSALFITTCVATLSALFMVGAIKSKFSPKNWFISGLETVLIGGLAASIAYLTGVFLKYLIG
ncbi:MAG: VIT1/CCC1 transporter family protein [Candidatus Peregrinibacteria bacterium]